MTSRDKTTDREYPKATQQSTALRLLGERTRMSLHGLHTRLHTDHRGSARHCCRRFRQLVTRQLPFDRYFQLRSFFLDRYFQLRSFFLHFTSHERIPPAAHIPSLHFTRTYSTASSRSLNVFHCQFTLNECIPLSVHTQFFL